KTGTTLVRQWRGHAHTILVREDGFEYEGQRYLSLTKIAERITGAHWSGPRFFGLIKRAGASVDAAAGRCEVSRQRHTAERRGSLCDLHRKSSEEGLQQEFNSLLAQREACEAFINSQRHEGWVCLRAAYDAD